MVTVAGLGFRLQGSVASLRGALRAAVEAAQPSHGRPITLNALATAADKATHPALLQLATELQLPIISVNLAHLANQAATPSVYVPARYGAHSVAEAAALAAAGPAATLLARRCMSPDRLATAALAFKENTAL